MKQFRQRYIQTLVTFMVMMILFVSLPQNKNVVTYDTEPLSEDDVKQMWSLNRDTDWIDMYVGLGKMHEKFNELPSSNRSVTIISAFFDVGLITKDGEDEVRDSSKYMKWAEAYKYMKNPMVIFTDKEYVKEKLLQIRKHSLRSTLVIVIPKHWLWSFRLTPWIEKIISNPDYPKYYPNTVNPEYASAMFAKTELVAYVAKRNFFQTKFHCWVDIGYFRYILVDDWTKHFWLEVPDTFDRTKIAMTGVFDVDLYYTKPRDIFLRKLNWLAGGFQLSVSDVAVKFNKQFQDALMRYLAQGFVNSDQEVIYAMATRSERELYPLEIDIQLYYAPSTCEKLYIWFYLGYKMYNEAN